ncbi:MAG: enoyl-CoA hydratase/isomerase family protein [Fidelibacterota bacterium]
MPFILKTIAGQIAIVTIHRPEALNALNQEIATELETNIRECLNDNQVGVVILTGSGEKAFIAGADIKKMQSMGPEQAREFSRVGQQLTLTIEQAPKPVLAAVNGFALGGGCEIALACHLRVASTNARFGLPEVSLGLIPGWGGTQRLARLVGGGWANEMILTGKMISAEQALKIGLVNRVMDPGELMTETEKMAKAILKNGPNAILNALKAIISGGDLPLEQGLELEADLFGKLFDHPETREGLSAFVEKRRTKFR